MGANGKAPRRVLPHIILSNKKEGGGFPARAAAGGSLEVNELGVDVPVGDPVDEVEGDEDGGGEPHGPGVDVVAERLFVRAHAPLNLQYTSVAF